MEYKLYKADDYSVSTWQGGTTTQLAIFPPGEKYADRNFIWRLSSATCDLEESDFTDLPDYNRILGVLQGEVVLAYEGIRTVKLKELDYDYFDGAYKTKSYGKCTDYNLMTRKGYSGEMNVLRLQRENREIEVEQALSRGFFCTGGYAVVEFEGNSVMIGDREQLVITDCPKMKVSVMGEGALLHTAVTEPARQVTDDKEERKPHPMDDDSNAFPLKGKSDFVLAMMLSLTDFRGSRYIFKKLQSYWYDEELTDGIHRLQRFYGSIAVYMAGILAILFMMLTEHPDDSGLIGGVLGIWTLACLFIISPLMYMAAAPKPIGNHIKDMEHLSCEDIKIEIERNGSNESLEKILKKYKGSGNYEYKE